MLHRRQEFSGRTDKYAPPSYATLPVNLRDVVNGVAPKDVSGVVLSDSYVQNASSRLAGYRTYWNAYKGRHFTVEYDGGRKKVAYNYCRKVVQKRASWLAGKGFTFYSEKGNELVSDVLERIWAANGKRMLIRRTGRQGFTTGDAFWYFTVKTKDERGVALPKDKWHVRITPLNPSFCFPVYTEDDPQNMSALMIQFPIWGSTAEPNRVFTAIMTPEKIDFYNNEDKVSSTPNVIGMIPVVHLPSNVTGENVFGSSLLEDIIPLNENYNEVANAINKIIYYHGEPTTIVYGARLSQMERGANKVWSNLPPPNEARVENLEMKGDLSAMYKYLDQLESMIYRHGRTPKISFDSEGLAISNTSGIAMQLMFQPLIEATLEEQDVYSAGIRRGNQIIATIHQKVFGEDLSQLADSPESYLDMEVVWASMLPKDEQVEMDMAEKKIALGIWSKAEAARRLSGVKNTEKLALELAADARYDIAIAAEKAIALKGQPVNMSAAFLSSIFLSEDLLDVAKEVGDLTEDDGQLVAGRDPADDEEEDD